MTITNLKNVCVSVISGLVQIIFQTRSIDFGVLHFTSNFFELKASLDMLTLSCKSKEMRPYTVI